MIPADKEYPIGPALQQVAIRGVSLEKKTLGWKNLPRYCWPQNLGVFFDHDISDPLCVREADVRKGAGEITLLDSGPDII